MRSLRISGHLLISCLLGSNALVLGTEGLQPQVVSAQFNTLTLAAGFTPDPIVLQGIGGGDRSAPEVVNVRQTPTGLCLGFMSLEPHKEITLEDEFSNLEMFVESELDTTLIVEGPGGIWCNDDSQGSKNPAIAGEWLPGLYRIWIGAYLAGVEPDYQLYISDKS